ncbi:MAG: NUDIX hydrolase [Bacteroidota bacterium]|nr:NUDIX hydrolase [Bacteroidota bacterium]
MSEEKFWKILSAKKGFEGKWIHINRDQVELPDKSVIEFEAIEFQRHGTGVAAESKDGKIILVKNYRYISDYYSWEIPAGTIPPEMDPADCVLEELKEEAGCILKKDDLIFMGYHYASIGSSNQKFYCYYARNVKQVTTELDANEIIEARWFTRDEIRNMITDGTIKDGFTLVVLLRFLYLIK